MTADAVARVRALHTPHDTGSAECNARCEVAHWGVQVCNADDHRYPCPTIRALEPRRCTCDFIDEPWIKMSHAEGCPAGA